MAEKYIKVDFEGKFGAPDNFARFEIEHKRCRVHLVSFTIPAKCVLPGKKYMFILDGCGGHGSSVKDYSVAVPVPDTDKVSFDLSSLNFVIRHSMFLIYTDLRDEDLWSPEDKCTLRILIDSSPE